MSLGTTVERGAAVTEEPYRYAAFLVALAVCVGVLALAMVPALVRRDDWRSEVAKNHPVTTTGIPVAGCSSFIVIAFFGAVSGPIKISLWGLHVEGAGGAVFMWILCLLTLALAARMTWGLKP
jgi:hypothetical protein